jgi:antitoxin component of MazEF toxin-antitoxin module
MISHLTDFRERDYCNYMTPTLEIPLTRIGNSRGIRLPAPLIKKLGFDGGILLEDHGDRVVLKPTSRSKPTKLSWSETSREMAFVAEDWSDWKDTAMDGLKDIPWDEEKSPRSRP